MPHFYNNWKNDDLRRFIMNGIVWTAKRDVPAAGVDTGKPDLPAFAPVAVDPIRVRPKSNHKDTGSTEKKTAILAELHHSNCLVARVKTQRVEEEQRKRREIKPRRHGGRNHVAFFGKHRQRFELVLYDFLSSSAISAFQMHRQEIQRWSSAKSVQIPRNKQPTRVWSATENQVAIKIRDEPKTEIVALLLLKTDF